MNQALRDALRPLRELPKAIESIEGLDAAAGTIKKLASPRLGPGTPLNEVLSGADVGHPVHPMLTDVAIGAWTSAVMLDLVGGKRGRKAADRLLAIGIVSAGPTVLTGLNDWMTLQGAEQRLGVAHAGANGVATALYGLSWLSRKRGKRLRGKMLALIATGVASGGAYLGGHLAYKRGVGVDHTAFTPLPSGWVEVANDADLTEGTPVCAEVQGTKVMVVRHAGSIRALADTCAHEGGPLHEGKIEDGCVVCPWHSSRFDLTDGSLVGGPSAYAQPVLEVRTVGGRVEVRKS